MNTAMKRFVLLSALALLAAACTVEPSPVRERTVIQRISATLGPSTRTGLVEDTKVFWNPSEAISVFAGGTSARFVSTNEEAAPVAEFVGTLTSEEGAPLIGLYPYREDAVIVGETLSTTLPGVQKAVPGTFDDNLLITAGRSSTSSIAFYNLCSGLRFTVTGEGIRRVVLHANGGEAVAGRVRFTFDREGKPALSDVEEGLSAVTLEAPEGQSLEAGKPYFIIVAPGTLEEGFRLEFQTDKEASVKAVEKTVTFRRGVFGILSEADGDLEWEEIAHPGGVTFNVNPDTDYYKEYWNPSKTESYLNIAVPDFGSTDAGACVFRNDLNGAFVTWHSGEKGTPGVLRIAQDSNCLVTTVRYFFSPEVADITTVGDLKPVFSVSEDGLSLLATLEGKTETVAVIDNEGVDIPNSIALMQDSEIAKKLLNTGQFQTLIGAKGYLCCNDAYVVNLTFNHRNYFRVKFIQPLSVSGTAADNFIDGVDFGEKGSFIRLEDLIDPTDWRGRSFSNYTNYWDYYGPFEITADLDHILCDMNGVTDRIPSTLRLKQVADKSLGIGEERLESRFGFLTYRNNGTAVDDFNLYVRVIVKHGWGELVSGYIRVPVQGTI